MTHSNATSLAGDHFSFFFLRAAPPSDSVPFALSGPPPFPRHEAAAQFQGVCGNARSVIWVRRACRHGLAACTGYVTISPERLKLK